ncbi:hypothetical protein [Paenibacillus sp. FSL R7-0337]|uniref:hypothetical protein n=1 Tax=Paenibacillus sp. FSL R7-0337 TaxID=1926588 RepID=UPI00096F6564|nr:hypothetical protein [Paenibacillus sp. FSL R7-0337]OMF95524.1 hypothetical protein BK147_14845 [Paenibacillus sp. FSL R7-0337]
MKEPRDEDRLLTEYFKLPVTPSPELVSNTIQRIQGRRAMGAISILVALQWLVFMVLGLYFLAGPAALQWKISMGLLFILSPMVAGTLLLYRTMGSGGGSYESSLHR